MLFSIHPQTHTHVLGTFFLDTHKTKPEVDKEKAGTFSFFTLSFVMIEAHDDFGTKIFFFYPFVCVCISKIKVMREHCIVVYFEKRCEIPFFLFSSLKLHTHTHIPTHVHALSLWLSQKGVSYGNNSEKKKKIRRRCESDLYYIMRSYFVCNIIKRWNNKKIYVRKKTKESHHNKSAMRHIFKTKNIYFREENL